MEPHHRVLRAKIIDHERSANGSGHVEQTEDLNDQNEIKISWAYLITVAQPKTTLSEELPPVMLRDN